MISSCVITTVFKEYLTDFAFLAYFKVFKKRSNRIFPMEIRLATQLQILAIVFYYGAGMPYIFVYCFFQYVMSYFADRFLFVKLFKPVPNHSNLMDRMFNGLFKYVPILLGIMSLRI